MREIAPHHGQTFVLACVDAVGDVDLARLRASLRGLGAALVVVERERAWLLQADDEPRAGVLPDAIAMLAMDDSVAVVDGDGGVRARYPIDGDFVQRLESALSSASVTCAHSPAAAMLAMTRRDVLVFSLVGALVVATAGCTKRMRPLPSAKLEVNGKPVDVALEPRVSLLDALRERLDLPGTKKGCDHGMCGACTVLVDGRRVLSCLTLAASAQGKKVTTIEGVEHRVQRTFIEEDALQCGACTPGQIMSAVGLCNEDHAHTDDEVREEMSGNLCRCGAYPNIVRAVQRART